MSQCSASNVTGTKAEVVESCYDWELFGDRLCYSYTHHSFSDKIPSFGTGEMALQLRVLIAQKEGLCSAPSTYMATNNCL